jgi:putative membrane protein
MKWNPKHSLRGVAIGMAEVIPGVSGGTIAFITGIYERLIDAIKNLAGTAVLFAWRREGFAAAWRKADGNFLAALLVGMFGGIVIGVFGIKVLLDRYPPVVWAFFFGLIVASVIYVGRQVGRWTVPEGVALIIGTGIAYLLTVTTPAQAEARPLYVFLAGMVAVSALILPGISGSFILLLLGLYQPVFTAVRLLLGGDTTAAITVVAFVLGCLAGLASFSRLISFTFKRFPHPTLALLLGFMLGSLNRLWPWRNALETRIDRHGEEVPILESNVLPSAFEGEPFVVASVVALLLGFVLVFLLERAGRDRARAASIEEEEAI